MKSDKLALVVSVVGIVMILLFLTGFAYLFEAGVFKGEQGEQGIQGISIKGDKGSKGDQGLQGLSPAYEWNGTSIRFQYPNGSWGIWVDLKGDRGARGFPGSDGNDGADGQDGDDGSPAPVNHPPVISLVAVNGTKLCHKIFYTINVNVSDVDGDVLSVVFSYRLCNGSDWKQVKECDGYPGNYSASVVLCMDHLVDCHWRVKVTDGSSLVFGYYNHVVG